MDFPRGGTPILMHHERKRLFKEASADVRIETAQKKTLLNLKKSPAKSSKVTISSSKKNSFSKKEFKGIKKSKRIRRSSNEIYKNLQFEDGLNKLQSVHSLPFIAPLTKKKLTPGLELLGIVKRSNRTQSIITLPNGLQGKILSKGFESDFTLLPGSLIQVRVIRKDLDQRSFCSNTPLEIVNNMSLKKSITPGTTVMGIVSSIEESRGYLVKISGERTCFLAMTPTFPLLVIGQSILVTIKGFKGSIPQLILPNSCSMTTNIDNIPDKNINEQGSENVKDNICSGNSKDKVDSELSFEDITPGVIFSSSSLIKNLPSVGMVISLNNGFMATVDAMHVPQGISSGPFMGPCIVLWVERNERLIGVSFLPHLLNPMLLTATFTSLIDESARLPLEISFCITETLPGYGNFLNLHNTSLPFQEGDPSLTSQALLQATSFQTEDFICPDLKFFSFSTINSKEIMPKNRIVKGSPVDWNAIDGLIIISDFSSSIKNNMLSKDNTKDIVPGAVLWGTVSKIVDNKVMVIELGESFFGICPRFHWFEKNNQDGLLTTIAPPLAVGDKRKFRVLDMKTKSSSSKLLLTRKPSLVRSTHPPLLGSNGLGLAVPGTVCHGYALIVKERFILFGFYGETRGIMPFECANMKIVPGDVLELYVTGFDQRKNLYRLAMDPPPPLILLKGPLVDECFKKDALVDGYFEKIFNGHALFSFPNRKFKGRCPLLTVSSNLNPKLCHISLTPGIPLTLRIKGLLPNSKDIFLVEYAIPKTPNADVLFVDYSNNHLRSTNNHEHNSKKKRTRFTGNQDVTDPSILGSGLSNHIDGKCQITGLNGKNSNINITTTCTATNKVAMRVCVLGPLISPGIALQGPIVVIRPWDIQPQICPNTASLTSIVEELGPAIEDPDTELLSTLFSLPSIEKNLPCVPSFNLDQAVIIRKGNIRSSPSGDDCVTITVPILSTSFEGSLWEAAIETRQNLFHLEDQVLSKINGQIPEQKETLARTLSNMPVVGWVSGINSAKGLFMCFSQSHTGRVLPKNAIPLFSRLWWQDLSIPKPGLLARAWIVPENLPDNLSVIDLQHHIKKLTLSLKGPIKRNMKPQSNGNSNLDITMGPLSGNGTQFDQIPEERTSRTRAAGLFSLLDDCEVGIVDQQCYDQSDSLSELENDALGHDTSNTDKNDDKEQVINNKNSSFSLPEHTVTSSSVRQSLLTVDATERILANKSRTPMSVKDYEKLVLADPSSSLTWIGYMAFVADEDIEKARTIAERALLSIPYRLENEKLNLWIAWLRLEFHFGMAAVSEGKKKLFSGFDHVLSEGLARCSSAKALLLAAHALFNTTDVTSNITPLLKNKRLHIERLMLAKPDLRTSGKIWLSIWKSCAHDIVESNNLLKRALSSLSPAAGIKMKSRSALFLYHMAGPGGLDRGRALFEALLGEHPKRFDIWQLYLSAEQRFLPITDSDCGLENDINSNGLENPSIQSISDSPLSIQKNSLTTTYTRGLFERLTMMPFSSKKMKTLFKSFLAFEKSHGTPDTVQHVRQLAITYVQSTNTTS